MATPNAHANSPQPCIYSNALSSSSSADDDVVHACVICVMRDLLRCGARARIRNLSHWIVERGDREPEHEEKEVPDRAHAFNLFSLEMGWLVG